MDTKGKYEIFEKSYERKLISSGNHYPSINLSRENLDLLCVLLHKKRSIREIQEILSIEEEKLKRNVNVLLAEGLIKKEKDIYLPTFMVITKREGTWLKELSKDIGNEIKRLIQGRVGQIIEETIRIKAFEGFSFDELSLFILSDVILDFIQIDRVEKEFLQAERPLRNGKNYYYSIMEKEDPSLEAFGIYGNHCEGFGDTAFCIYGNQRYSNLNFITLTEEQTVDLFGERFLGMTDPKRNLLQQILRLAYEKHPLDPIIVPGLERLQIVKNGILKIPILDDGDFHGLEKIADVIKDGLIEILTSYKANLLSEYVNSPYVPETTFEEFFIWYYHFLYSYVTDQLIAEGFIKMPEAGISQYILV